MTPILYDSGGKYIGNLADAVSCTVTEELNGEYELEMEYPLSGWMASRLEYGQLVLAKPNETSNNQYFRIYKISSPMQGNVTVYAEHISYDLSGIPVKPFTATGIVEALNGLVSNSMLENPFTVWTDISESTAEFTVSEPKSFRALLGGTEGSILDTYSGSNRIEFEFDNYLIKVTRGRGSETGVTIEYGKNLTDLEQEQSIENTYTGVIAFFKPDSGDTISSDIQYVDNHANYPRERIYILDATAHFKNADRTLPSTDDLNTYAAEYAESNDVGAPKVNLGVSFATLWQTEEYKNIAALERVSLGDKVTVYFPMLQIDSLAEVIKTVYDTLKERYRSIELGDAKSTMVDTIQQAISDPVQNMISSSQTVMQIAIDAATKLIQGGLGGHVVINTNASGQPNEILIMDTEDKSTAVNVIRMNVNGIGFSTNGYNGPFTTAWTIDGKFNADFITTGTLNANLLTTGQIKTADGLSWIDLDNSEIHLEGIATQTDIANANAYADEKSAEAKNYADGKVNALDSSLSEKISTASTLAEQAAAADEATRQMLEEYQAEIGEWINFDSSTGMTIGASGSSYKTNITNDRMAFQYNGQTVAYTSANVFYVPQMVITGTLQIGNYILSVGDDGKVTIFIKES